MAPKAQTVRKRAIRAKEASLDTQEANATRVNSKANSTSFLPASIWPSGFSAAQKQKLDEPTKNGLNKEMVIDICLTIAFLCLSAATRLYKVDQPASVIFDEFHFYDFVALYRQKKHIFDIHPPLGKLILLAGGVLGNFKYEFEASHIGKAYPSAEYYLPLRLTAAVFGALIIPVTYATIRLLGCSVWSSVAGASMILFETLILTESRYVLVDSQLLFFTATSFMCALILWKQPAQSRSRWAMVVITGFFSGCAFGIKWTALATPGVIAIVSFFGCFLPTSRLTIRECIVAASSGLVIYIFSFWVHFKLTVYSDSRFDGFMPKEFRQTLIGNALYDPSVVRASFFDLFVYLNKEMFRANAAITTRHPWESKWYEWPLDLRGVHYFSDTKTMPGFESRVYLIGNPVVFFFCLISVAAFVIVLFYHLNNIRMESKPKAKNMLDGTRIILPFKWFGPGIILFGCFWLNILPYALVERAAFIYHYIPALYYGLLLTTVMVDRIPLKARRPLTVCIVLGSAAAFLYWSPWVYGIPLTLEAQQRRRILPRWN